MNEPNFISFKDEHKGYEASLSINSLFSLNGDIEILTKRASHIYRSSIDEMRLFLLEKNSVFKSFSKTPVRLIWKIGDRIFKLTEDLENIGFVIDDTYNHLERDLKVKRKWLEKVVILRRYIDDEKLIPINSVWGDFEKGTKKKLLALLNGHEC